MIKRIRDLKKFTKVLQKVSFEDWEDIQNRALYASKFLDEKNPAYMIMQADLEKARSIVLENRLHEVREERTITDTVKKVFVTPKQEQLDELVGQAKYINSFLKELRMWVSKKQEIERLEADGRLTIDRENRI